MRRSFCVLTFSMPNFIFGCSSTVNCAMLMLQIYRIYSNYPNKKVSNFEKNRIFLQYIHNSFSFTILSLKGTISLSDQNFQFPTQILNFLSVFIYLCDKNLDKSLLLSCFQAKKLDGKVQKLKFGDRILQNNF